VTQDDLYTSVILDRTFRPVAFVLATTASPLYVQTLLGSLESKRNGISFETMQQTNKPKMEVGIEKESSFD
jgi:hypothetical protein